MSELVDSFMEHHPISPVGTTIKPDQLKAVQKEVRSLRTQLAKANDRVKELEGQLQLTMLTTHEASFESDYGKKRLNKFAIEKKIEGVNGFVESFKFLDDAHCVNIIEIRDAASHYIDEQLRKEQANEKTKS